GRVRQRDPSFQARAVKFDARLVLMARRGERQLRKRLAADHQFADSAIEAAQPGPRTGGPRGTARFPRSQGTGGQIQFPARQIGDDRQSRSLRQPRRAGVDPQFAAREQGIAKEIRQLQDR
ncbi:hypothetical protein RZS08_56360, partial [Arthrospira platensis SPKY1]|nr:hypothetical protein [Arthrospira platensis SPKY1]